MQVDETEDTTEEQSTEEAADTVETENEPDDQDENAETFPREYVEKLRKESRGYRERAKAAEARVDELSRALYAARVEATQKFADTDDAPPFDPALLDDADAFNAAIDDLLTRKPHLGRKRVAGSVGQGVTGNRDEPFSLLGRLKQTT